MKRKIIFVLIAGLLLFGIVIAIGTNNNIKVSKERKDALKNMNLLDYEFTDYSLENGCHKRCLYKEKAINHCFDNSWMCSGDFTEQEKLNMLDTLEEEFINKIADVYIERKKRREEVIDGGTTTIT